MKPLVKKMLFSALSWALIVFLLPQAFVYFYYFPMLFHTGSTIPGFIRVLSKYALTISWVSAPILTLLYIGFCLGLRRKIKWWALLIICIVIGFTWILIWNLLVYPTFGLLRSIIPLSLCSIVSCGYAIGNDFAQRDSALQSEQPKPTEP
jgi:hypothetical protein